jgi:flagellar biogenesis protein FliO
MEPGTIANIALSLLFVALAMLVFFLLLKRYSSNFTQPEQDQIRIVAQRRMALKSQLILIETDTHMSLIAVSGENVAPIWTTTANSKENNSEVS